MTSMNKKTGKAEDKKRWEPRPFNMSPKDFMVRFHKDFWRMTGRMFVGRSSTTSCKQSSSCSMWLL